MENRFIIDWFSFSTKYYDVTGVLKLLNMENCTFETLKGMNGYKARAYYESVSVHYDGGPDMGVWCEMSGKGCRAYESYGAGDYEMLFKLAVAGDIHITRLDVAYDDFDGIFNMKRICEDTRFQNYVSRWKSFQCIYTNKGDTVLFGSRKSDIIMRIYDKAAEQGQKGIHWIRLELQMRDDRALGFVRAYLDGLYQLGDIFTAVINNYLRFVVPTNDSNRWRWPNTDYWDAFIGDCGKLSIYEKPGTEYTLECLYDFVIRQCGNAVDTYVKILSLDKLIEDLKDRGTRPNPKYKQLVDRYQNLCEESR